MKEKMKEKIKENIMKNEIEPHYVDFTTAKWLKEKGFNLPTIAHYLEYKERYISKYNDPFWKNYPKHKELIISYVYNTSDNGMLMNHTDMKYFNWNDKNSSIAYHISAPEKWQVVRWLRINHNIDLQPICNYGKTGRTYRMGIIYIKNNKVESVFLRKDYGFADFIEFNSPQEAYSAAFNYIKNNNLI